MADRSSSSRRRRLRDGRLRITLRHRNLKTRLELCGQTSRNRAPYIDEEREAADESFRALVKEELDCASVSVGGISEDGNKEVKVVDASAGVKVTSESFRAFAEAKLDNVTVSVGEVEAEAKVLDVCAGVKATPESFRASAKAKLASASVSVGGIVEAEAKVLNANAGMEVSNESVRAFVKAEVASASVSAGPVKATIGMSVDTGVGISPTQVEAKVLGIGFSVGRKMGVSLFGNSIEFDLW